jgi:hypothetical protein
LTSVSRRRYPPGGDKKRGRPSAPWGGFLPVCGNNPPMEDRPIE